MLTGVGLSNGWDPSGTVMYSIDSPTQRVNDVGDPPATPFRAS
jgi:hypothetical protein